MFIYLTLSLFITSFILIGGYFYLNYMFNKQEITINKKEKEKPYQIIEERKYMKPKVFFQTKEEINSSLIFYEFMANLDWEEIKLPSNNDNETVKTIINLFSLRVIETNDIVNHEIDIENKSEINKKFDMIFETNFNKMIKETINSVNLKKEIINKIPIEIYKYETHKNKLDFFSEKKEFDNNFINSEIIKIEEKIKIDNNDKKKEIFIFPYNLFYTIIYSPNLSTIKDEKLLTTLYIEDIFNELKINRVYELVGIIIFNNFNVEIIGIKIGNIFYFRNLVDNSKSVYLEVDFEKEIKKIINSNSRNIISVYGRKENAP